jgi:hypothetical protein
MLQLQAVLLDSNTLALVFLSHTLYWTDLKRYKEVGVLPKTWKVNSVGRPATSRLTIRAHESKHMLASERSGLYFSIRFAKLLAIARA